MSSGWMCNCCISVRLRTEHESGNWACLPDNSTYINSHHCEKFEHKQKLILNILHTQCVSLGKADDEDIKSMQMKQYTLYSLRSQTSNYNYVH